MWMIEGRKQCRASPRRKLRSSISVMPSRSCPALSAIRARQSYYSSLSFQLGSAATFGRSLISSMKCTRESETSFRSLRPVPLYEFAVSCTQHIQTTFRVFQETPQFADAVAAGQRFFCFRIGAATFQLRPPPVCSKFASPGLGLDF